MRLFGVVNASPDSLNEESIVRTPDEAQRRADRLVAEGVWGFDLGGQGSTFAATQASLDEEWGRLAPVLPVLAGFGLPISIDTWQPEVARRALGAGATWLNAADGLQEDGMWELAAEAGCPVVLPFLSGPDPLHLSIVTDHDPVAVIEDFFEAALRRADRYGIRRNVVLDPGTGFAPHDWPWEERFVYQKAVYSPAGPAPGLRPAPLHRPAVEGHAAARRAARHRADRRARVRPRPLPRPHHRGGAPLGLRE